MFQSDFSEGAPVVDGGSESRGVDLGAQDLISFADSDYEDDEDQVCHPDLCHATPTVTLRRNLSATKYYGIPCSNCTERGHLS